MQPAEFLQQIVATLYKIEKLFDRYGENYWTRNFLAKFWQMTLFHKDRIEWAYTCNILE